MWSYFTQQAKLPKRIVRTILEAELTAAAATQQLALATIPAGHMVLGVDIALTTPFTGGALSAVTMSIGTAAVPTLIVNAANVLAAAVVGKASTRPLGAAPQAYFPAAQALVAEFAGTGANVNAATAGALTITILLGKASA
jgi:hypothetical protein